jgi:glucose/arabinose dehydrogenase
MVTVTTAGGAAGTAGEAAVGASGTAAESAGAFGTAGESAGGASGASGTAAEPAGSASGAFGAAGESAGGASGAFGTAGESAGGASGAGGAGTRARAVTCVGPPAAALAEAWVPAGYCAWVWADGLSSPRGVLVDENGDVLVVARGTGAIVLLYDDDRDGVSGASERVQIASASGLNHGIALDRGFLYASSATTVFRWAYAGDRQPLATAQSVITGLPSGGHVTRTLVFDAAGNLYVSIGSRGNVDSDSSRARIVRFTSGQLATGATLDQAEVFADGLRNEVGLRFDAGDRLWGVENGSDNLNRADLGGDIHNDNPGEELNLLEEPGGFYGYPYCWSEGSLPLGNGPTTQWAYNVASEWADAWCQDPDNVVPPVLSMQAHSAPLDLVFYSGGSFPNERINDAFVAFHGSWNRSPATGYKVVHLPYGADGRPTGEVLPFLEYAGEGDTGAGWPHRPVGLAVGKDGRLFVTSDASGVVLAVGHDGT